jgi:AMMECR1 domain-containing protein
MKRLERTVGKVVWYMAFGDERFRVIKAQELQAIQMNNFWSIIK